MKTNVYSVFDVKAAVYGTPFFMPNDAMAVRAIGDACNDPQTMLFKHPEDFTLVRIGSFDDVVGVVTGTEVPAAICPAASLKRLAVESAKTNGAELAVSR